MKSARIVMILLAVMALSRATVAKSPPSFQPQTTIVLGTATAGTGTPFTQVITQLAGELAMSSNDEHFVNLAPNWAMLARMIDDPKPVIAYTTAAWADEILRITCWVDRAKSDFPRGRLWVVMEATEGTTGSIPIGTIFGTSDARLIRQDGMLGLTAHNEMTPGVFPDVLPTSLFLTTHLVPDLWLTGKPGRVSTLNTFTSVAPPDGSAPIVTTLRQRIPIR
jgi:hypothetical protein